MTPFRALYEYPPPLLQQIPVPCATEHDAGTDTQEKDNIVALLQHNLVKAQLRMKKYADAKRTEQSHIGKQHWEWITHTSYFPGGMVLEVPQKVGKLSEKCN